MQVQLIIKDTFSILDCSDNKMVKINPNEIQKQKKEKYLHCSLLWSSNDLWLIQEQKMLWAWMEKSESGLNGHVESYLGMASITTSERTFETYPQFLQISIEAKGNTTAKNIYLRVCCAIKFEEHSVNCCAINRIYIYTNSPVRVLYCPVRGVSLMFVRRRWR